MSVSLLAFSVSSTFTKTGAVVAFAALLGIAVLARLVFSQAREIRGLRGWAGRAPERAADMEQRVSAAAAARVEGGAVAPQSVRPVPRAQPIHARPAPAGAAVRAGQAVSASGAPAAPIPPPGRPRAPGSGTPAPPPRQRPARPRGARTRAGGRGRPPPAPARTAPPPGAPRARRRGPPAPGRAGPDRAPAPATASRAGGPTPYDGGRGGGGSPGRIAGRERGRVASRGRSARAEPRLAARVPWRLAPANRAHGDRARRGCRACPGAPHERRLVRPEGRQRRLARNPCGHLDDRQAPPREILSETGESDASGGNERGGPERHRNHGAGVPRLIPAPAERLLPGSRQVRPPAWSQRSDGRRVRHRPSA